MINREDYLNDISEKNILNDNEKLSSSENRKSQLFISLKEIKNQALKNLMNIYYYDCVIGDGGNMKVFFGKNKKTGENVVIKLEKEQKKKNHRLLMKQ